ncbi:ABC transporter ATP-binding protein [Elioraea rosea]|uniref:ABC transporter ATP-binding protein n=1 Tax=Elioraea rosea TaxID=2492390 RepID=UPI0011866D7A|nr:ABC transporter ATP-binding protein [Elioraea rosea]
MSVIVQARGVVKEFAAGDERLRVLHGIDLDVRAGELMLVVGPSGCGKTTLISILAGILSATEGAVRVGGRDLAGLSSGALAAFRRETVGFIFQQYNLLPSLTAAENAAVPLVARGERLSHAEKRARAMLERLGMGPHASKQPRQLSGGQMQRVAIARALVHDPAFIVCDEPTAALDAASGRTAMELLSDAARSPGRAVVVVTHDPRIYGFADRLAMMEDGRVTDVLDDPDSIRKLVH